MDYCEKHGRFIPAHAGNTQQEHISLMHQQVHPRSRGEYLIAYPLQCYQPGSSPLTRGIRLAGVLDGAGTRFIPAHAGNTAG